MGGVQCELVQVCVGVDVLQEDRVVELGVLWDQVLDRDILVSGLAFLGGCWGSGAARNGGGCRGDWGGGCRVGGWGWLRGWSLFQPL